MSGRTHSILLFFFSSFSTWSYRVRRPLRDSLERLGRFIPRARPFVSLPQQSLAHSPITARFGHSTGPRTRCSV
ncbi:hypothetical protein QBC42DRAFT_258034 [Cladorrhinum samala]|uniref:Secreted protein n=1 Tax=Cladorrhinum samala TaxID=585594 RepID=A0AAV9I434_9PEZI|nr:hypothetical protein QBC42DRAFT_258034 [Cladorrhinum samala]